MNSVNNSNLLRALTTRLGAKVDGGVAESVGEAGVSTVSKPMDDTILKGPAVTITNISAKIRGMASLHNTASMLAMMNSVYETMKNIVDNLAPSDKELLERERQKEELEKLIRQFEDKQVTLEEAARRFENIAVAAADRALLDANMASEAQPKA